MNNNNLNKISLGQKTIKTILYIWKEKSYQFALLFFGLIVAVLLFTTNHVVDYFDEGIDPFVSIITLVVAIGLALSNFYNMWEDSLPKTLTVHLIHNKKFHLSCFYTDLVSESETRVWGQQVLKQMAGNKANIDFRTHFDINGPEVIILPYYDKPSLHYTMFMFADKLDALEIKDKYIRWYVVHADNFESETKKMKPHIDISPMPIEPTQDEIFLKLN